MDILNLKEKIQSIIVELEFILKNHQTDSNRKQLERVSKLVSPLKNFFNNDENVTFLIAYQKGEHKSSSPLDILCDDILQHLESMDSHINQNMLDELYSFNATKKYNGELLNRQNRGTLNQFISNVETVNQSHILNGFNILKHLSGHNKTLIVLGPNGSGKTSFANYLKCVDNHVRVIPAAKPIRAKGYISNIYSSTIDTYNHEIYGSSDFNEDLLQKLIIGICSEHDKTARIFYSGGTKQQSKYEKIKEVFNEFFDVSLNDDLFGEKLIQAQKNDAKPFAFNSMSDGERAAFFYIATVVVAPEKSFIIVDEPENHLNPAIYNKIWDKLITLRKDCQFIFISHTMEFINARTNFELIKIKEFIYPNEFELEFLGDSLENINSDFIVEIVGSRKPILFCEGSKFDFDYKIYEILFGEKYTIIPTGNCLNVINSVSACNLHANTYSIQSAIGIIDSDLKSLEEISSLKAKYIFVLTCNEIEMLLLDENIFKKSLMHVFKDESTFEQFKNDFFKHLICRKNHIIKRLIKTQVDEKLKTLVIDDKSNSTKEDLKINLSMLVSQIDIDVLWNNGENKLADIIEKKDYEQALKYCCLEHKEIINGIGNKYINDYHTIALGVLKEDAYLAELIRKKYFPDIW